MKNEKIENPKLCKTIGLGKLFVEKITFSSIGFLFYAFNSATESVRRLSHQFSRAQDHILLKNRLKIKEVKNSISENLNRKSTT